MTTILLHCFLFFMIFSQSQKMTVRHSDKSFYDQKKRINRLTGNVKIEYDSLKLSANKIIYYIKYDYANLYGNIEIISGKYQKITSSTGSYYSDKGLAKLYTNVKVVDKSSVSTGDTIFYYKEKDFTEIYGHGKIIDSENDIEIEGDYISSDKKELVNIYGNAVIFQPSDSVKIYADTLILDRIINKSFARNNVKIYQDDVFSEADFTEFNHSDSTMILTGNAHLDFDGNDVKGDSIFISFLNKKVNSVDVIGHAQTVNTPDSSKKVNKFQGKEIYMNFSDQKLKKMRAIYNAISVFYFEDDAGANSITADSIHVYFKKNEIDYINEFGGVQGIFYPAGYSGKIKNE